MKLTRRGRAAVGCGLALVAGAVVLATPALLVAGALLLAWLLGAQVAFVAALRRERDALSASVDAPLGHPAVGEATVLRLAVDGAGSLPLRISLDAPAAARRTDGDAPARSADRDADADADPAGATIATTDALEVVLDARGSGRHRPAEGDRPAGGDRGTEGSIELQWPIAGQFRVGPARATATDRLGLFAATFETDAATDVVVRAHEPETTHFGTGDERVAAFGTHTADRRGPGTEPAELRPYESGDEVGRIDWNATARLQEAYVAASEAETDRRTVLFVDHRATSAAGPPGGTSLDYLRYAALALVESARSLRDPLGCFAVGDEGVTVEQFPRATPGQYDAVAASLRELVPTTGRESVAGAGHASAGHPPSGTATAGSAATVGGATTHDDIAPHGNATTTVPARSGDPAVAATKSGRLAGDDAAFARRLRPLLSDATPYRHRVEDEPLFAAVRTYLGRLQGTIWSVLLTDGERPGELREAVKLARRGRGQVLVVLAPAALFGGDRPVDGERSDAADARDATDAVGGAGGGATVDAAEEADGRDATDTVDARDATDTADAADTANAGDAPDGLDTAFARRLAAMDGVTVRRIGPGDAVEQVVGAGGGRR